MTDPNIRALFSALDDARGCVALLRMVLEQVQECECREELRLELKIAKAIPYRVFLLQEDQVEALRSVVFMTGRSVHEAWQAFVPICPLAA